MLGRTAGSIWKHTQERLIGHDHHPVCQKPTTHIHSADRRYGVAASFKTELPTLCQRVYIPPLDLIPHNNLHVCDPRVTRP